MDILVLLANLIGGKQSLNNSTTTALNVIMVVIMVISLLQCFFGYRLMKIWITLAGLVLGILVGSTIAGMCDIKSAAGCILTILIFTVLFAFMAFKLFKFGVFIQCFGLGFIFGAIVGYRFAGTNGILPAGFILGLAAGILGVVLVKPVFIISTGLSGGVSAGACLAFLIGNNSVALIFGAIFAAAGIYVQYMWDKKRTAGTSPAVEGPSQSADKTVPVMYAANTQPVSQAAPELEIQPGGTAAVRSLPKNKKIVIIAAVALLAVIIAMIFAFKGSSGNDPLYGTWYIRISQSTIEPVPITFTKDDVTFGAGSIQNSNDMTMKYEKIGSNSLKIYSPDGSDSAECTYQIKDGNLYIASPTERTLNMVLTKGEIKVPVN